MEKDICILRELAGRYAQSASEPINQERVILHRAVNDREMIRPVVLIDELPWDELDIDGELICQCEDKDYREAELYFRQELYKWKYMQADMILCPFYGVRKLIDTTGIGIQVQEEVNGHSHKYINQINSEEDIEKIHNQTITYREKETKDKYEKIASAIGDILPVKITGMETGYNMCCKNWDDIVEFMGPEKILYGLIDEPEMMHKLTKRLTDIFLDTVRQYEELNLFEPNQITIHGTTALNSTLCKDVDYNHVTAKNMWGRGIAQILSTVSKEMRNEFDIQYMKQAMEPFGLVYYGCCEPLHNMIDIVEQIPNIRKISITPWANVDIAADNMGSKYVMAFKANPAYVTNFDTYQETARNEIKRMLDACKRNHTSCDVVLKDVSTANGNPQNIFKWEKMAMEMITHFPH